MTTQPVSVTQVVSRISVPGEYLRLIGTVTPRGASRKWPASRSRRELNALGESKRGRHSHSTEPPRETSAAVWQSERKP